MHINKKIINLIYKYKNQVITKILNISNVDSIEFFIHYSDCIRNRIFKCIIFEKKRILLESTSFYKIYIKYFSLIFNKSPWSINGIKV